MNSSTFLSVKNTDLQLTLFRFFLLFTLYSISLSPFAALAQFDDEVIADSNSDERVYDAVWIEGELSEADSSAEYFEGVDMEEYLRDLEIESEIKEAYRIGAEERAAKEAEENQQLRIYVVYIPAIAIALFFYYKIYRSRKNDEEWEKGLFPKRFGYSKDNLMEAYLRLASMMIRHDNKDIKEKINYIHSYFNRYFPTLEIDFQVLLKQAYRHPISLKSAGIWLKRHLPKHERIQVLYFLAGIAVIDGDFNPREKSVIIKFSELLELSKKDLESILSMYSGYEWQNRRKEKSKSSIKSRSNYKLDRCSKILGVSSQAMLNEIKKAYRQLVKLHHPDRFATASTAQQKIATERFIKIQQAYEYLIEIK